jgi:hypothetical protein
MGLALNGRDMVARAVGGDTLGFSGTATGTTGTSLTDSGASFTASSGGPPALGGLVGHVVVGLRRRLASWAHTNGTATYTVSNTFTANGSDTLPQTIAKIGLFQHFVNTTVTTSNSGIILFQTLLSSTATLSASGDNVAITDTVTIS